MTLLQTVPNGIDLHKVEDELVKSTQQVPKVNVNIDNLHVWKLSESVNVGTVHIKIKLCGNETDKSLDFQNVSFYLVVYFCTFSRRFCTFHRIWYCITYKF